MQQAQFPGGTASFPDGIPGLNQNSILKFQSLISSEAEKKGLNDSVHSSHFGRNIGTGGLKNRLQEIVASPIYSESGGAPGRKFFFNVNNGS